MSKTSNFKRRTVRKQQFLPLYQKIEELLAYQQLVLVAIDGNSAAGKTSLAHHLASIYPANVFAMDDFFLPANKKTAQRLAEPGGNVDYQRFFEQVLTPLKSGQKFSYRPFDCSQQVLSQPVSVDVRQLNFIEGTYSMHPILAPHYHLKVFMAIDPDEQINRILKRDGPEKHRLFIQQWIPLENKYIQHLNIQQQSDLVFWSSKS